MGPRPILALLVAFALGSPAFAGEGSIRDADRDRIARLDEHLGRAVREAFARGEADALDILGDALSGAAISPGSAPLEGEWSCRTIKMGDLVPIVAYGNFRCAIAAMGPGHWTLTKLTGSQRTRGDLNTREGGVIVYLGVGHVGAEPATDYAGLPPDDDSPVEPNQSVADIGLFEQMSGDRARLLQPDPVLESRFDILYLTR
ncbi:MAG: DUF4893 domain-containing protein [Jannaschia sp.]